MIEDFIKYFESKEYKVIQVNVLGINLYYTIKSEIANVIMLYDFDMNNEVSIENYNHVKTQIMWKFINMGFRNMELLNLIIGKDTDKMKALCMEDDTTWIIDNNIKRLIIYENQKADFLNIKVDINNILAENASAVNKGRTFDYFFVCNTVNVIINIIIFIICELGWNNGIGRYLYEHGILNATLVFKGDYYRLITYMYLHSGVNHVANNMIILLYLGNYLEKSIGKIKYIILYFLSGIIAGAASIGYNNLSGRNISSLGASGAVFGVVGAMAYIIIINKGKVKDIGKVQILIFIFLSLYGGFINQRIDNAAHIGGLISGFLIAALLYRKKIRSADEKTDRNQENTDRSRL